MKIYYYKAGEHRFDENGIYLGWFNSEGTVEGSKSGAPFDKWEKWDTEKHEFLTKTLGFSYKKI